MANKRIDGYEVPVYHFESEQEREKFLDERIADNYIPNGMRSDKGLYMGRDAVYVYKYCEPVMVATI